MRKCTHLWSKGSSELKKRGCFKGIFLFHPVIPDYPNARFPGVVLFSEIYQGKHRP